MRGEGGGEGGRQLTFRFSALIHQTTKKELSPLETPSKMEVRPHYKLLVQCLVYTVYIVYTVYTACAYTIQTACMPRYILAGEDLSQLWD